MQLSNYTLFLKTVKTKAFFVVHRLVFKCSVSHLTDFSLHYLLQKLLELYAIIQKCQ